MAKKKLINHETQPLNDIQIKINAQVAQLVVNASTGYNLPALDILDMVMHAVLIGAAHIGAEHAMEAFQNDEKEN